MIDLYRHIFSNVGTEIVGLNVKIYGFNRRGIVNENNDIKSVIDKKLLSEGYQSIETVSNTFFPVNLWNPSNDRKLFYDRYHKIVKKIRKCSKNRYGIYFERMINYSGGLNQIEEIIQFYHSGNHRRSAMQVSIWDPTRDLKNTRMRGFPCMQQIVFSVVNDRLILFVFFATQFCFQRAYGNFLGLCNLGRFMSHELRLPLSEINCYIGVEILDITKQKMKSIIDDVDYT